MRIEIPIGLKGLPITYLTAQTYEMKLFTGASLNSLNVLWHHETINTDHSDVIKLFTLTGWNCSICLHETVHSDMMKCQLWHDKTVHSDMMKLFTLTWWNC